MECTECIDKLSDFLLDELPEKEAVLVQEHLALCPECMSRYKQLKGTGRAMEAIPAMRSVSPTKNFDEHVMSAARIESQKIIETLPPEKRLRMETRAASRKAQLQSKAPAAVSQRKQAPISGAVVGILILGLVAATCIMLYPSDGLDKLPKELGTLSLAAGKAEQFFQKQGEQWSQVNVGKPVRTDDEYATRDDGRIRFEMEGGSIFVGPQSEVKFRRAGGGEAFVLHVPNGEMGVARADDKNANAPAWIIRTDAASISVPPGSEVYVRAARNAQGRQCDVLVRKGSAGVSYWSGKSNAEVKTGEEASFWEDARIEPQKSAPENLLPLWRMDLLNDAEMSALFGGAVRVIDRRAEGPVVELSYGFGRQGGMQDWAVAGGASITQKPSGTLVLPAEARCTLVAPLTVPASVELAIHPDSPKDGAIACVLLDTDKGRVSADFDRQEAVLTVREPDHPGASRVPFRAQAKALERVRLDFVEAGLDTQAILTTASGKSKPVNVSRTLLIPGAFWVSALREEAVLEGLRVTGQVPRKWLRLRLAGTP